METLTDLSLKDRLPKLFILGAAKCGTTSLAHQLSQHPEVFVPKIKECEFFNVNSEYSKGIDYYVNTYFNNSLNSKLHCEATPSYLRLKKVPLRIKAAYGNAADELKFIVMVRNPVERAWSHYLHRCRNGAEELSFEAALDAEEDRMTLYPERWCGYFRDGLYGEQLAFWFENFNQENFLILRLDHFQQDPELIWKNVCQFIGVDVSHFIPDVSIKNKAGLPRSRIIARMLGGNYFVKRIVKKMLPFEIKRALGIAVRSINYRAFSVDESPKIKIQTKNLLHKKYAKDIALLELVTGQTFSEWRFY